MDTFREIRATLDEKSPNTGTPPANPKIAKYTLAQLYKLRFDININKYSKGDREYILANLSSDVRFINQFVKKVCAEAETIFETA